LARKIMDAREAGIPILMAVGAREAEDGTVSMRRRDGRQEILSVESAVGLLKAEAPAGIAPAQ
jgi:threonyl-tRNA synthetase